MAHLLYCSMQKVLKSECKCIYWHITILPLIRSIEGDILKFYLPLNMVCWKQVVFSCKELCQLCLQRVYNMVSEQHYTTGCCSELLSDSDETTAIWLVCQHQQRKSSDRTRTKTLLLLATAGDSSW